MTKNRERCDNCHFYREASDWPVGQCVKRAPTITEAGHGLWPQVRRDSWCGEWKEELDDA